MNFISWQNTDWSCTANWENSEVCLKMTVGASYDFEQALKYFIKELIITYLLHGADSFLRS
jgi:hypothetical protein